MSKGNNIEVPGPKSHWLMGLLREFIGDTLGFLQSVEVNYGSVAKFRILRVHNYLISDPLEVNRVFQDKSDVFIKNTGFFRHFYDIFGQGLLTSEGATWKKNRSLLSPVFRPNRISNYLEQFSETVDEYLERWGEEEELDFHEFSMKLTADIATKTLFGIQNYHHDPKLQEAIRTLERQISVRLRRPFLFQDYLPTKSNYLYRKSLTYVEKTVIRLIDQYKTSGNKDSVLSLLVDSKYEDGSSVTEKQLRDEALTLFLAGHDSTAILLSWAFYLISEHNEVLVALRNEWANVIGEGELSSEKIRALKYTQSVVDEVLRLFPPAYLLGRQATEDYSIGKYVIPAGAPVIISPYVMGRNPKYFHDPTEFKPGRWTDAFRESLPRGAFIPFGGGKRICIGEYFAKTEAIVVIVHILRKYNVQYCGDEEPEPLISINMPPKNGMPMLFSRI